MAELDRDRPEYPPKLFVSRAEKRRQRDLVEADIAYRREEMHRKIAQGQIENGLSANLQDSLIPPTPELLAKDDFRRTVVAGDDWYDQPVVTYRRRVMPPQIERMNNLGILDDNLFLACKWYRQKFEGGFFEPSPSISGYAQNFGGEKLFGHLAKTEKQAQARSLFRWAAGFIGANYLCLFDAVVLNDFSIKEASSLAKYGYNKGKSYFIAAAGELHFGIGHLLIERKRGGD